MPHTLRSLLRLLLILALLVTPLTGQEETTSIASLIEDLKSADVETRRDAAYELARRGSAARAALAALTEGVDDGDEQVWSQSTMAIARIGPAADAAIPALLEKLGSREDQRRYRAAYALGMIGPAAREQLKESLGDESDERREGAALALYWMGEEAADLIPQLLPLLGDTDDEVRGQAVKTLGACGPYRRSAAGELVGFGRQVGPVRSNRRLATCPPPRTGNHRTTPEVHRRSGAFRPQRSAGGDCRRNRRS